MADTFNQEEYMEEMLSLEEFINLPTTVAFQSVYSERIRNFINERPYIRLGAILENAYAIAYTHQDLLGNVLRELGERFIDTHSRIYTILDTESLYASGINSVQQIPGLDLRGRGVLLGFVDTGIDYTKPAFIYEDGTSKIQSIWDQTIPGNPPADKYFGSVYSQAQINEALASDEPLSIVPHTDTVGHGTFLASVAGSRDDDGYIGAAPDAEIVVVKLKKATEYYLATTSVPPGNDNVYEAADIMMGVQYIIDRAAELGRPVAICIALGTNFGSHDGFSLPEEYLTLVSNRQGVVICTAAGNEAIARHHTDGMFERTGTTEQVEVQVTGSAPSFSVYIWTELWDKISVSIISPTGEKVDNIPFQTNISYERRLILEDTIISISYFQVKSYLTIIIVTNPTPGIWTINLHGDSILAGEYHAWLPITGMISPNVAFLKPEPNYTIVNPATAIGTITCGAYNSQTNSLYAQSSRGPTRLPRMSPDFVAPGVDVRGIYPNGYGTMSGTSVAAAVTIGACALLLQWGIVERNEIEMNCSRVRALLIAGCERDRDKEYPNVNWGYGKLNLLNTFNFLRQ